MSDSTIAGAIIGVIGTILGTIIGLGFSLVREIYNEKVERQRLATLLIIEIQSLAQSTIYCSTLLSRFRAGEELQPPKYRDIERYVIKEVPIYKASVSSLKLLPLETCAAVVEFYNTLENCIRRSQELDSLVIKASEEIPSDLEANGLELIKREDGSEIVIPELSIDRRLQDDWKGCGYQAKDVLLKLRQLVDLDIKHINTFEDIIIGLEGIEKNEYLPFLPDDYIYFDPKKLRTADKREEQPTNFGN